MSRPTLLGVEQLESRDVPTLWGYAWPDPTHLTLSFAPDGTSVGGQSSNLHQALNRSASPEAWQREVLRAFQTWASVANINFGLTADGGQAIGTPGRLQGDPRFGDIRVSALQMSPEVLAVSSPFLPTAGTWSGDVRVNSSYQFGVNGSVGVDLYTALLQEAGHTLGLGNSPLRDSVMYEYYHGPRTGLSASDITAIQAMYGARQPDAYEGRNGNDRIANASSLSLLRNSDGSLGVGVEADLTTATDVDFYRFQVPLNLGSMTIRLRTGGLSLASARITVYDSAQRVVGVSAATDPLKGGVAEVRIDKLLPLGTYYVKVEGATKDVFGIGSYRLEVGSVPLLGGLTDAVGNVVDAINGVVRDDLHTDDTILTANLLPLSQTAATTDSRFDHAFQGRLRDARDVDHYGVTAPVNGVLTAMVWGTQDNGLLPKVSVYDARGRAVASEVLVNEAGTHVVQVVGVQAGEKFFVRVEANDRGTTKVGNYFVGIDFSTRAVQTEQYTSGTLSAANPHNVGTLVVTRNELYHFVLAGGSSGIESAVRATFYDKAGRIVGQVTSSDGEATSVTLLLGPGRYTVSFTAEPREGKRLPTTNYRLTGMRISDPIGPQAEDPTGSPQRDSFASSSSTASSGGSPSSSSGSNMYSSDPVYYYPPEEEEPSWYWYDGVYSDPYDSYYSDPYSYTYYDPSSDPYSNYSSDPSSDPYTYAYSDPSSDPYGSYYSDPYGSYYSEPYTYYDPYSDPYMIA